MDSKAFYDAVYSQDSPRGDAHGWMQWKGTDVCMELHCKCGYDGHFDGEFFYFFECPDCKRKYAVGEVVKLIELTPEQITHVNTIGSIFQSPEEDSEKDP